MAIGEIGQPAERASSASAEMVGRAHESVVQVRAGGRGAGAGVIWDEKGLVLTNHHVVAGRRRNSKATVVLRDGREFEAEVVKRGRDLDLALLRVENGPGDLPAVPVGDSDALRVGGLVYAIGHPWGRLGAVTAGVVSGLGVAGRPRGRARYVQSDVSLAPGNSGGPLLNFRGEVVGINAMIFGNLALSIPSNAASAWLAGERHRRPRLGVRVLPVELPVSLRDADPEIPESGLMVAAVEVDGPAARVGLLVGDVLLGADDETPDGPESLLDAIAGAGDAVRLRVMRGGKISFVDVDLKSTGRAA
jgi:serine protease Do